MKTTNNIKAAIKYFLLVAFAIVTLFPFYWMIASSLKSSFEVIQTPPTMVPDKFMWSNFSTALSMAPFGRYFINTIIVTALSIVTTVVVAILSAFAFSHLEFKGRDLIFSIFLASMMIPGEVLIVTNFKTISTLKMIDSYIKTHTIKKEPHEELMAMSCLDKDIANIFNDREMLLTMKVSSILIKGGFNDKNIEEKVHLLIGIIDNYCHEVVYHKHKDLNYDVMKEELLDIIVNFLD